MANDESDDNIYQIMYSGVYGLESLTAYMRGYTDKYNHTKFEPADILSAADVMDVRSWEGFESYRSQCFFVANFAVFTIEDGEAVLYFGEQEANPIMKNSYQICRLVGESPNQVYPVTGYEMAHILASVESGDTLRVPYSELDGLKKADSYSYLSIPTDPDGRESLTGITRELIEKAYGNLDDSLGMLNDAGIKTTRIYLMKQRDVQWLAGDSAVMQVCLLKGMDKRDVSGLTTVYSGPSFNYSINSRQTIPSNPVTIQESDLRRILKSDLGLSPSQYQAAMEKFKSAYIPDMSASR